MPLFFVKLILRQYLSQDKIWENYQKEFKAKIIARDKENERTKVLDQLTEFLSSNSDKSEIMPLLAWEIGIQTRRERVELADTRCSSF